MDHEPLLNLAHVTNDGYLTAVSDHSEKHPEFGTDGYQASFRFPLTPEQLFVAGAMFSEHLGQTRFILRSALGQLGLNAGDALTTDMRLDGYAIVGNTLLTHFDRARSEPVLEAIKSFAKTAHVPIGRAALLPDASRLHRAAVQDLLRSGDLSVSSAAGMDEDGSLLLPLENMEFKFDDAVRTPDVLQRLIAGSARAVLKQHRILPTPGRPNKLQPRRFLVTGVHLETHTHHVFLRSILQTRGLLSRVVHTEAAGLIAGRTRKNGGDRQFEIVNFGDCKESTKTMRVIADVHRPAHIEEEGV